MVEPITIDFFDEFKTDACTVCGECLTHCPIIEYDIESAKTEMRKLITGKKTKKLLRDCQSCFTCNLYCPHDAKPASLILQRWNEQYKKQGLKIRGKYFMTLHPNYPNFRSYAADRYNEEEKQLVQKWRNLEPLKGDTLTYPGCNVILTPTLTQTSLFDELDIRGRLEYCCGETLFK
jgi:formate hydrogenlyase subunit 6/NADH:ubiquinone oxidoreductase subunit I